MKKLSREITLAIVQEHGSKELLNRLSDPFWFQAFGCVLGFDWHSSGLTTTTCGAMKEGLKDVSREIGIFVCGGKGGTSRKTPYEIEEIGSQRLVKVDPEGLIYASRMSAKVDSAALQDGYDLYHHSFIFDRSGHWAVIQQGMNPQNRWARRYHWFSERVSDFVCEPHAAIISKHKGKVLNLVAKESLQCRKVSAELAAQSPDRVLQEFNKIRNLYLPARHPVSSGDIKPENLKKILIKTYEKKPKDFEELLGIPGVGPKTIRALSLISELVYGHASSLEDPARFSFAHGGKDGHPFRVNRGVYDQSIEILHKSLTQAEIGLTDKLKALRRLSEYYQNKK